MQYFIGIEDLVANALIELLNASKESKVSFRALDEYGVAVVSALRANGDDAVLLLSRDRTRGFIKDCSDLFDVDDPEDRNGCISLKSGVTENMLIERFCVTISIPVLRAMSAEGPVNALLQAAA